MLQVHTGHGLTKDDNTVLETIFRKRYPQSHIHVFGILDESNGGFVREDVMISRAKEILQDLSRQRARVMQVSLNLAVVSSACRC